MFPGAANQQYEVVKSGYAEFPEYRTVHFETLVLWGAYPGAYHEYGVRKFRIPLLDRRDRIQYQMFEINNRLFDRILDIISLL